MSKSRMPQPVADRIARHAEIQPSGCWLWTGSVTNQGYGSFRVDGVSTTAHRAAYEALVGPVPAGLVLDHLCRNRRCCNPKHLDPVSQRENTLRSPIALGALNAAKTHCPKGHPYNAENTYVYRYPSTTVRRCRECARLRAKRSAVIR